MLTPKPTVDEIKAIRNLRECGLEEAKQFANKAWWSVNLHRIKEATSTATRRADPLDLIADLVELLEHITA